MSERGAQRALVLVVLLYLALAVAYSLVNPLFESPDEALNYANVRFFAEERRLPVLEPGEPTKAHHPPLYYVLEALLTLWVPDDEFEEITGRINPFWAYQTWRPGVDNKSLYLHDPALEGLAPPGTGLGVHLARWLSLLFGAGTVLLVYATAREAFPRRPALALGGAALTALNPMFLFVSASVHDDPLANLVSAATLYVTARLLFRGPTTRRAAFLGLLVGLGFVTKLTCLLVLPTVGLALLYRPLRDRGRAGWREVFRLGIIVAGIALAIGGWWFVRNVILYGDPTSMVRQTGVWGVRDDAPDLLAAARELGFLHDSLWGVFGYGQIPLHPQVYLLARLLGLAALGGLALFGVRRVARTSRRLSLRAASGKRARESLLEPGSANGEPAGGLAVVGILSTAPLVALAVNFARMTISPAADFGRYLFVSLAILAPLYVLGLSEWWAGDRARVRVVAGLSTASLALAIYGLAGVLWPAYAAPRMLSLQEIEGRTRGADLRFGDGPAIRLAGYDLEASRVHAGDELAVTLCWEALASMDVDYVSFVHLVGPGESVVGSRDTHPGLSRYPTRRWTPGDAFCDVIPVPIETWAPAPAVYGVEVGWYDPASGERLAAYGAGGVLVELVALDRVKVAPEAYLEVGVPIPLDIDLEAGITLLGYDVAGLEVAPGGRVDVTLYWAVRGSVPADYTVFVHLAAPDGPPHAQDDGPPRRGAYPTSFWDVGEVVVDPRTIHVPAGLPAGDYPLVAGMYLLETGVRLRRVADDGSFQGDLVPLATLTVGGSR